MPTPQKKAWRFTGHRRPATPGANWTSGGAYRNLPAAEPRPDARLQRATT